MSNDEPLVLTARYQINEADFIAALRYPRWGDPVARRRFFLRWAGCVVAATLQAAVCWRLWGANPAMVVSMTALVLTLYWPFILYSQPKEIAKQFRKLPTAFEPGWATVRPEALLLGNEKAEARREWQSVRELVVTGQHTLFFFGPQNVLVIPWRAFETPSEAQRFSELARRYWFSAKSAPPDDAPIEQIAEALGPERIEVSFRLERSELSAYFHHFLRWKPQLFALAGLAAAPLGVPIGALVGVMVCPWIVIQISVRQASATPGVLSEQAFYFSPRGIWVHNHGMGQGRVEWSAITEIEGSPRFFLLKRGPLHAIIVPRRAFGSGAEADQFLAQVTRWYLPHAPAPSPKRKGR